ncbi:hypothetical protein HLB44_20990 [Aquincola sp. S2]|uniref:Uncharacterized protein n=1 Tax=Pseudaquabacterium terrae TaxID=2732868 RepID=A0ABX2ELF6_9BURK|nr:hypothetical protein [Aquabacterium terrae]NRF69482.1 hypothetical protein [Aquabacterium terrae]
MTMRWLSSWVLSTCLLLTACGGGDDAPTRQPRAAQRALAATAPSLPMVSTAEAARQLLDFAQTRYPDAFPGQAPMQWFSPFAFRHYPETGLYLGVALHDEAGYRAGGVYLLSSAPGAQPQFMGLASSFVAPKRQLRTLDLVHNALIADPARGVYYASVAASVSGHGNRIATIDAESGSISYSAVVGQEPGALALAADGRSLYVGLDGSGDVLRLALPGLQELARVRLPKSDPYFADSAQMLADRIAASPAAAGVIAVSLRSPQTSAGGVVLVREMVIQARRAYPEDGNQLIFAPDGQRLFGLDTRSSGYTLGRFDVGADGLTRHSEVATGSGMFEHTIGLAGDTIVTRRRLWNAHDLSLRGVVGFDAECLPRNASTLLCHAYGDAAAPRMVSVDLATLTIRGQLAAPLDADSGRMLLGPGGHVAWRSGFAEAAARSATRITLLRDEMLGAEVGAATLPIIDIPAVTGPDGTLRVALPNTALIADPARGVYYASVPGSVPGNGNRIASIDATTGKISFSAIVGSEPGALALASDGKSLYVALDGSAELLRLALPGMKELARLRLPRDTFHLSPLLVQSMAASPTWPGLLAVSLRGLEVGMHAPERLLLIGDMALLTRTSGGNDYDQFAFSADGAWLYGLENQGSGFALGRIELVGYDLVERFPRSSAATGYHWHAFDSVGSYLIARNKLWKRADLSLQGTLAVDAECLPRNGSKLLCLTRGQASPRLLAVAVPSLAVQAELAAPFDADAARLVIGPGNSVALREGFSSPRAEAAAGLVLLRNDALR